MLRRFLLAFVVLAASLGAAAQEAPDALVKRTADEILTIVRQDKDLQSGNQQKVVQLAEQKVLPYFDFERMTRLAVGRSWQQANPQQRQALVSAFRTMLVRTYSSSLSQYRNQTIEVKPLKMAPSDTDVTVRTAVIQQGGPPIPIDYAMEKKDNTWKVYDVTVDGASLVTTYRGSFADQIQKGGIDGLVKTLQERNQSGSTGAPGQAAPK
jgi:phospholipid transport system substrate-binding protein